MRLRDRRSSCTGRISDHRSHLPAPTTGREPLPRRRPCVVLEAVPRAWCTALAGARRADRDNTVFRINDDRPTEARAVRWRQQYPAAERDRLLGGRVDVCYAEVDGPVRRDLADLVDR